MPSSRRCRVRTHCQRSGSKASPFDFPFFVPLNSASLVFCSPLCMYRALGSQTAEASVAFILATSHSAVLLRGQPRQHALFVLCGPSP